jgi:mediator of RNA polymerase II transcription subunit 13
MAFCIYPGSEDLTSQVNTFMEYLGATFESCKLGAHVRTTKLGGVAMGLVPVKLADEQTLLSAVQAIHDSCVALGKALASIDWQSGLELSPPIEDLSKIDSFVIYLVNPFEDENEQRGLMELCAAFWDLYEAYCSTITSPTLRALRPDVVLQVVPVRCITKMQAPVVMDGPFFQKLVREVYDRCPPAVIDRSSSRLPIESGAAVQLEQPLPRKIDFKLQAEPPSDLLHEGSNMHLAYSRSKNGEWISVAWTDTTGKYQASSNYCLVGGRSFGEVARVIWQSTIEIMQARRVAWRLCIARVGVLEREELDVWSMLATSASKVVMITVIMAVDPRPAVSVYYDPASSVVKVAGQQGAVSTPVGTPRSGVSPESVLTPAATPAADPGPDITNDPDAHLVDIGDETWGLILGHRTNISSSVMDYRPSLSTGFLLKSNTAGSTTLDDPDEAHINGLILVGIKLVWIGSSPKPAPAPTPQPQSNNQQPSYLSIQSPFNFPTSSSPPEMPPSSQPPTPGGMAQQLNTSTSAGSIPKVTADSILRDYLQMYRNLGVLARARGLRGTRRGGLPWHVVVVLRAVEGLEGGYGSLQNMTS